MIDIARAVSQNTTLEVPLACTFFGRGRCQWNRPFFRLIKMDNSLSSLFAKAEKLASKKSDGHLTLLKFSSGWKAALYTPDFDSGEGREQIQMLPSFSTKEEALKWLIAEEVSFLE